MTSPDHYNPGQPNTGWGDVSEMATDFVNDGLVPIFMRAITGGLFSTLLGAQTYTAEQLATMNDHTQQLTQLQAAFDQLILQGNATVFLSNNTYYPTAGLVSIDVILIGAGGAGGNGRWDVIPAARCGGAGGGGGGEVHTAIPGNLLPKDANGAFLPIPIFVGAGGSRGASSQSPGTGGGNTGFSNYLTAGGGVGGGGGLTNGTPVAGTAGGLGMIPGGTGGASGQRTNDAQFSATRGGNSVSSYDLHGGGGGGGGGGADAGGSAAVAAEGGAGGISPGGQPSQAGSAPSSVVATGGGGGGGGTGNTSGGSGAFPGGGGGGGFGASGNTTALFGGLGGNGIVFIIERFT